MVNLVRHDLDYILKQIKIAEAHAAGGDLADLVGGPLVPYGLRTVDGSYNNLVPGREQWGAADSPFPQLSQPSYRDEGDDQIMFGTPTNSVWMTNNDYGTPGNVVDADPRLISNLIVDQTNNNPVATQLYERYLEEGLNVSATPLYEEDGVTPKLANDGTPLVSYQFDNISPDIGDSAPYSSLFTLFGQFFDHGLDHVAKGGNGTVYMPLSEDDPLYNANSPHTNFMALSRASVGDDAMNTTTPWVDQNQTYGSHSSVQVFLREYVTGPDGRPIATGDLLHGEMGGMATWGDLKQQAADILGIHLTDLDVGSVPLIAADQYGNFIPGANGFPQLVVGLGPDGEFGTADDVLIEGNPADPVDPTEVGAFRTDQAFLLDIAHRAVPVVTADGSLVQDADAVAGNEVGVNMRGQNTEYDNELLDAHFMAGDGRANENIGLTAIHHIFHSEHNLVVAQAKEKILSSGDLDFLNEWLLEPLDALPANAAEIEALVWNGERLFQVGRFTTEMEYQHLVFEEFARKMQPDVDAFLFEPDPDINPAIFAEFANVVYRFGHSMLNETVDRINADGSQEHLTLFDAFLNPLVYDASSTISHEEAVGAIIRGMSAQVGNEIDEFVTNVLRNQLTGIPLDLAAINIARGRETGMPTLNEARAQFQSLLVGGDSQLDPYTSWTDFALNMKNPESIVNFIAAYGTHDLIEAATTLDGKRAAAMAIVFGGEGAPADRLDFLGGTGAYAEDLGGLNGVDLWMGGLAEKKMDFGGMLGSTFSAIFELQMENLQDGDRFYYLSRVQGMNLLSELESNSLAKMALRATDLEETGTAIPGDFFSRPDRVLYVDHAKQMDLTGLDDPEHDNATLEAISNMVERRDDDAPSSVSASGLPDGVSFDPATGAFSGSSTVAGSYQVIVTATYENGTTATHTIDIVIAAADPIDPTHLDALVDDAYYNATYGDVAAAGIDPDTHFAQYGWNEGRNPNAFFSTNYYLAQNPDVAAAGLNALEHYLSIGWKQGRNPSPLFDVAGYLAAHPDVAAAGMNPLTHYIMFGQVEGRAIFPAQPSDKVILEVGQPIDLQLPDGLFQGDGISDYLRYNGGEHVVLQGSDGNDTLIGGEGDDTLWGGGGDDRLEGGYGVDHVHGGDGDDIITNSGTDIGASDFLHGDAGNDVIHGGAGLTLMFGNQGQDFMIAGPDGKTVMGGIDNDFILGGDGMDFLLGEAGDDWMEGGGRFDTLAGENSELFFNSTIIGHDVLNGQNGDVDYDAESGDDIMFQGVGIQRNNGMAGFDWATHKGDSEAANSDLGIGIFQNQEEFILRDRFDLVEGLSGWKHNDILTGRSFAQGARDEIIGTASIPAPDDPFYSWSNALTEQGVRRIDGLRELLSHLEWDENDLDAIAMVTGDASDILLGGDGSDTFEGKGGDDIIDGDAWLNVRIEVRDENGAVIATADGLTEPLYHTAEGLRAQDPSDLYLIDGQTVTLENATLDRIFMPDQLHIVREILHEDGSDDTDTAIFAGNRDWYEITHVGNRVHVARREDENIDPRVDEGTDVLINVERIQFSDQVYTIRETGNVGPTGRLIIQGLPATEDKPLTVSAAEIMDENNPGGVVNNITYRWQVERNDGTGDYEDVGGVIGDTFIPGDEHVGLRIRVIGSYIDAGGVPETVFSSPTDGVVGVPDEPTGPLLISDMTPTEGQELSATVAFTDPDGTTDAFEELLMTYQWQYLDGGTWLNVAAEEGGNERSFTPGAAHVGKALRVQVTYEDDSADVHTVTSEVTAVVGNNIMSDAAVINGSNGDAQGGVNEGDNFVQGGNSANTIAGLGGNDTINGGGGSDVLHGGAGNDTLTGGAGDDTVNGGSGDDTIIYGTGDDNDTIEGGAGADTLRIVGAVAGSNDTARVELEGGAITRIGGATVAGIEYVDLDLGNGTDTIDYNGTSEAVSANLLTGTATGFTFIRGVENVIGGNGDDTLLGNNADNALDGAEGNDTLRGGFGNDTLEGGGDNDLLYGEQGDDTLAGGAGNDRLDGGAGNDTASYSDAGAGVTVALANPGVQQNTGGAGLDTLVGVENLTGSAHGDNLSGDQGSNIIDGGAGADAMTGGQGDDTYVVDNAGDAVTEAANGGNDTVRSSLAAYTLAGNVENLVLAAGAGNGTGNALDNVLTGNSGNNVLNGDGGTDTLLLAGTITDHDFAFSGGNVTVTSAGGGTDTLVYIERIEIGGATYDIVAGNNAANVPLVGTGADEILLGFNGSDRLEAGGGDDILVGGNGIDTMLGDAGNDTYVVNNSELVDETGGDGIDTIISTLTRNLENANHVSGDIENITLIGSNNTNALGNELDNLLVGNSGNNTLNGRGGADTLAGNGGNDDLFGGAGDDILDGGAGTDTLNGGAGIDTAVFAGSAGDYRFNFTGADLTSVTHIESGESDTLSGVERLRFDNGEVLDIVSGDGELSASGPAIIVGGAGNDTIAGSDGNDVIIGGAGDDILNGHDVGDGDDDVVVPQLDDDTFIWSPGDGLDTINGGGEGAGGDTFQIVGNDEVEIYRIYTFDEAVARIAYAGADEAEIVVTRQGADGVETVIAELTEIEEIVVAGGGGGDTVEMFGNFETTTSLRPNTITIVGSDGDDTVDISSLLSAHRIVFKTKGGNDTIIGALRPQDVVELEEGKTLDDYQLVENEDGSKTISSDTHSVTFFSNGGLPQFGSDDDAGDHDDDDDHVDDDDHSDGDDDDDGVDDDHHDDDEQDDDEQPSCDEDEDPEPSTPSPVPATADMVGTVDDDALVGTDGDDTIMGLEGRDVVFGKAGNDDIFGGDGADMLYGDGGNDRVLGGDGDDFINAGAGRDTVFGGNGDDLIVAEKDDGGDTYYGDDMVGSSGNDTLDMSAITASITADLGTGFMGSGSVSSSQTGYDTIWGIENIVTGSRDDTITASDAVNVIDGGAGEDTFRFLTSTSADGDTITSFQPGDKIDLSGIDANGCASGNQAFTLVSDAFTGSRGELLVSHETRDGEDFTVVQGNTSGGSEADFKISIKGSHDLTDSDFNL